MIEGCADQLPEERFIEALRFAQNAIQPILDAQEALAKNFNRQKRSYVPHAATAELSEWCEANFAEKLRSAWFNTCRQTADEAVWSVKKEAAAVAVAERKFETEADAAGALNVAFEALMEKLCRTAVLERGERLDGRGMEEIRPLGCAVDVLPKTVHGSALFERGQTQALVSVTLGAMHKIWMRSREAHNRNPLFYITTSRPTRSAKRDASVLWVVAKSVTAHWRNVRCCRSFRLRRSFRMPFAWCRTL